VATFDDLLLDVRSQLGEPSADLGNNPGRWTDPELSRWLVRFIRKIQQPPTPADALISLRPQPQSLAPSDGTGFITLSSANRLLSFKAIEYDGRYGYQWKPKSLQELEDIARGEYFLTQDQTSTRVFAIWSRDQSNLVIKTYPTITTGRAFDPDILIWATESGDMTLPDNDPDLQEIVILQTVALALRKKSYDIPGADSKDAEAIRKRNEMVDQYNNLYGLSPAIDGQAGF